MLIAGLSALVMAGYFLYEVVLLEKLDALNPNKKQHEYHGWWPWDGKNVSDYEPGEWKHRTWTRRALDWCSRFVLNSRDG